MKERIMNRVLKGKFNTMVGFFFGGGVERRVMEGSVKTANWFIQLIRKEIKKREAH